MKLKKRILESEALTSGLASVLGIAAGLLIGFIVLLIISPSDAPDGILTILKNFFAFPSEAAQKKYLGNTLVKSAPLLMCSLSVLFCYKTGLFNIGVAGQYTLGAGAALFAALQWGLPWYLCLLIAAAAGSLFGALVGVLKAYRNVNEVISGIMLNWISLYSVNMLLGKVKETTSPYTESVADINSSALMPRLGSGELFYRNRYVTIAIPLAVLAAVVIWVILGKTVLGFELRATGLNRNAARYSGMKEKKNMIVSLAIGGLLAGLAAGFMFLSGYEQWSVTRTSLPPMGFNGIAAAFLGGLHPIGAVFSSYFIQHITSGGSYLSKTVYPAQMADLISSIIIYLCGFVLFFKMHLSAVRARKQKNGPDANAVSDDTAGKEGDDE